MNYVLGLDVGIASVGWAVLELDEKDEPIRIIDLSSRIFDKAEVPRTGASLAQARRIARGVRRRLRRRRFRLHRVRSYLIRQSILTKEELQNIYHCSHEESIYELRYKGLSEKLSATNWGRLLLFFAKHRGFRSNRKNDQSKEDGLMLKAISENEELLKKYRTVGEMIYSDEKFKEYKRNKGGNYQFTVSRSMLIDEIKMLFETQRKLGQFFAEQELEEKYLDIFSAQRNFDEGPGGNGFYSGNQIEKKIGVCTFEKGENGENPPKRAPKASYAFMAFNLWGKINHLRINSKGTRRALTQEEKEKVAKLSWEKASVNFSTIRKELQLSPEDHFTDVRYTYGKTDEECEKGTKWNYCASYHTMRKALDKVYKNRIKELMSEQDEQKQLDDIAYAFTVYKSDEKIKNYLLQCQLEEKDVEALLAGVNNFSGFGHLSNKACYKILLHLKQGYEYAKACEMAGYDFKNISLEDIKDIPNPVVKRAIIQTLKVVHAVVREYGNPVEVHIELARELGRNFKDRKLIENNMEKNQKKNDEIKERIVSKFGIMQPTGQDIVKLKLCEQQDNVCVYSQKSFDRQRLFEEHYVEVDHIIPYSRSFDDTYANKVLVFNKENQNKGNKLPLEYLANQPERKEKFIAWVKSHIKDRKKRDNLLRESYSAEDKHGWKQRNLKDTQYISSYLYRYLMQNITLAPGYTDRKERIISLNGAVTGYVRKRWGIPKIRANGDLHHAVDAVVIACINDRLIKRVTEYSKAKELEYTPSDSGAAKTSMKDGFPEPWYRFRQELEARLSETPDEAIRNLHLATYCNVGNIKTPFVSRMLKCKVTGQANKETIGSGRLKDEEYVIEKTLLTELKLDKNNEIEGYYRPEDDKLLYEALKKQLMNHGGKGDKAFQAPFYKPKSDGTPGPLVKKVKLKVKLNSQVHVYQGRGIAQNGDMIRIDVFCVNKKGKKAYYFVPIYVADTVKKELPNKAVVSKKPYSAWKLMDEKDFIFSLYKNSLIYVEFNSPTSFKVNNNGKKECTLSPQKVIEKAFLYYEEADRYGGTITVVNHDDTYKKRIGIQTTLTCFRKCVIDPLGRIFFVEKEKRQRFQ